MPESQVNVAERQVNLSDVLGRSGCGGEIGPVDVLALYTEDSTVDVCASMIGCENT